MPHVTLQRARAAKRVVQERLAQSASINGIGITRVEGEYAVKVNLREPLDSATEIPAEIDGVRVCVEVTGSIRKR